MANFGLGGGEYASADEVANAIAQQNEAPKANTTRLNFDEVRETLDAIDDEQSLTDYGNKLKIKNPNMTAKQADAISRMFNKRREELKQQ